MSAFRSSAVSLRLCALIAFVAYLLTGASLALPTEMRCLRCDGIGQPGALKTGASCPLSYNGQHCHHGQEKTASKITLCPDGCLHHEGTGGTIPSLVKFLSPLTFPFPTQLPVGTAPPEQRHVAKTPFLSPLDHPPPSLRA